MRASISLLHTVECGELNLAQALDLNRIIKWSRGTLPPLGGQKVLDAPADLVSDAADPLERTDPSDPARVQSHAASPGTNGTGLAAAHRDEQLTPASQARR